MADKLYALAPLTADEDYLLLAPVSCAYFVIAPHTKEGHVLRRSPAPPPANPRQQKLWPLAWARILQCFGHQSGSWGEAVTRSTTLLMISVSIALFAGGCGQKGPLVLPQPAAPKPAVETTPPADTNNEQ